MPSFLSGCFQSTVRMWDLSVLRCGAVIYFLLLYSIIHKNSPTLSRPVDGHLGFAMDGRLGFALGVRNVGLRCTYVHISLDIVPRSRLFGHRIYVGSSLNSCKFSSGCSIVHSWQYHSTTHMSSLFLWILSVSLNSVHAGECALVSNCMCILKFFLSFIFF